MAKMIGLAILAAITVRAWFVTFSYNCGYPSAANKACYAGQDTAGLIALGLSAILLVALVVPPIVRHRRRIAAQADNALIGALAAGVKAKRGIGKRAQGFAERVRERAST